MEKTNPYVLLVRTQIFTVTMEKCMGIPQKIERRTTILQYFSRENKIIYLKRYIHSHVHFSIIYNPDKGTAYVPING